MKKADILTPIGIVLGITILLLAIFSSAGTDGIVFFIQVAFILIVLGGIVSALFINFSINEVKLLVLGEV